jgi:hypothetical protein
MQSMQETLDYVLRTVEEKALDVQPDKVNSQSTDDATHNANKTSQVSRSTLSNPELDQDQALCPGFRGHTSSTFVFNAARKTIRARGINPGMSTPVAAAFGSSKHDSQSSLACPIGGISKDEARRLCRAYSEGVGTMYPILDVEQLLSHIERVFSDYALDPCNSTKLQTPSRLRPSGEHGTDVLELVLAISLTCESGGRNPIAERLFKGVRGAPDAVLWDLVGIPGIQVLALMVSRALSASLLNMNSTDTSTRPCIMVIWMKMFERAELRAWQLDSVWRQV